MHVKRSVFLKDPLGAVYSVRVVNERTSVASFARAVKGTRLTVRFRTLLTTRLSAFLARLNKISGLCEKMFICHFEVT